MRIENIWEPYDILKDSSPAEAQSSQSFLLRQAKSRLHRTIKNRVRKVVEHSRQSTQSLRLQTHLPLPLTNYFWPVTFLCVFAANDYEPARSRRSPHEEDFARSAPLREIDENDNENDNISKNYY